MAGTSITIRDYHKEIPGELVNNSWIFPQINSLNSHNKTTEWRIQVKVFAMRDDIILPDIPANAFVEFDPVFLDNKPLDASIRAWINVDSRIADGKIRKSVPTIISKGKNIGKASATNVVCQALRDALGEHNKHLRKVVGEKTEGETTRYPPMLAQTLKEQAVPPTIEGSYVQRKFNGVRTVTTLEQDGSVIMYSRRKKTYPGFVYIKQELQEVLKFYWDAGKQLYLDGEIYRHGTSLQDISGQARREDAPTDIKYNYMIYDCFIPSEPTLKFTQRKAILDEIFENFQLEYAKPVETWAVQTIEEVMALYQRFIGENYEGAMLRLDEPYRYSYNEYHSKVLLKIKATLDAEFPIVGWETGEKGKAASALMIICETNGQKFPVTPAMEIPDRIELAKKMNTIVERLPNGEEGLPNGNKTFFEQEYLGKPLIVYFDEYSNDNIPQRARTKMEIRTAD